MFLTPPLPPSLCAVEGEKGHHIPGSGFLHSIADSMRETAGVQRHDKPSTELPEGEAPAPGKVGKITASVAEAAQVAGWGAQGIKPEKKGRPRPEEEAAAVAAPAADASVPAVDAPAVGLSVEGGGGGVDAPKVEGGLTLPSGDPDVGGEIRLLWRVHRSQLFLAKRLYFSWVG